MRRQRHSHFGDGLPCCDDIVKDPPEGNEDCIDKWEDKSEEAEKIYELANAHFTKLNAVHLEAEGWESKLKAWLKDLCDAQENAEEIAAILKSLIRKVGTTVQNAHATRKVVEAVLCLVKEIFECIVDLIKTSPPEELAGCIQDLKDAINCDSSLDEEEKADILTCIKLFEDKITLAYEMQKDVLEGLLKILNCANLLVGYLQKKGGLKWQLRDLQMRINGAARRNIRIRHLCYEKDAHVIMDDDDDDTDHPIDYDDPDEPCNIYNPPCGDDVFKPDQKLFPINQSQYFKKVEELYSEADHNEECLKEKKEIAKELRDHALDRKNQFEKALEASNSAEKG